MGNTVCVRIPGVQFEFKLHSIQDLIGHFRWSVSSFSKCKMQGSRRGRQGEKEGESRKEWEREREGGQMRRREGGVGREGRVGWEGEEREGERQREGIHPGKNEFLSWESQFTSLGREISQESAGI